jgi:UDPglucose 6-dehydrogenase
VPTPQSEDGACNTGILELVIEQLFGYRGVVIAKSTASPAVYQHLEETSGLKLAHVPEFLTQANAIDDYLNPKKIVVGCRRNIIEEVTDVITESKVHFPGKIEYCAIGEAAFFKYMANTFLAMKVIMNNEYYDFAKEIGLDWAVLSEIAKTDSRLGDSHWAVPGPDGSRGFGGACFPKDTQALSKIAADLGIELSVLASAITKNYYYRNNTSS